MKGITDPARRILFLLRKSEHGLTIEKLCSSLHVTPMAVHRPITVLEERGLVRSESLKQGRGRPSRVYKATERSDDFFPNSYGRVLMEFLKDIGAKEGIQRIRKLFEARFRRFVKAHRGKMNGKDFPSRVHALTKVLRENNYLIEQEQVSNKKFIVRLMNCPIARVAKEYPHICSCEQKSLAELLQAKVRRDCHILKGQNYCSYVIQK
jgi:DeoR family suf operon transcriptional repressor